ncbi:hypothetical protein QJV45_01985 [Listeria booriae]|uniref:hypothetical protein n=1 Tax=Listeria booriae TaxID=1552123 RepID=UPI001C88E2D8|nr:hypothetical protein [Listeria booriae]MDT0109210.1 hypothetical protein [Listeria booriae]
MSESKLIELENRINVLEFENKILKSIVFSNTPEWAKESLNTAKNKGLLSFPAIKANSTGSYDFYRLLKLLVDNKII